MSSPRAIEDWTEILKHPCVIIVVGKKKSGKTATGFKIIEDYHKHDYKTFAACPRKIDSKLIPDWLGQMDPDNPHFEENTVVLFDDFHMVFHARDWASPEARMLDKIMSISRHMKVTFIITTQFTRRTDVDTLTDADFILFKRPGVLHAELERTEMRKKVQEVQAKFDYFKKKGFDLTKCVYVYSDDLECMLTNASLPSFWTEDLSTYLGKIGLESDIEA